MFDSNLCLIDEIKSQFLEDNGCNSKLDVNLFIEAAYIILVHRLEECYKVELAKYLHHEINFMCPSLYFDFDRFKENYKRKLTLSELNENYNLLSEFE